MTPRQLETLRKKLGFETRKAFCADLGIAYQTYWRWLKGGTMSPAWAKLLERMKQDAE